jgi:hypothetical protein
MLNPRTRRLHPLKISRIQRGKGRELVYAWVACSRKMELGPTFYSVCPRFICQEIPSSKKWDNKCNKFIQGQIERKQDLYKFTCVCLQPIVSHTPSHYKQIWLVVEEVSLSSVNNIAGISTEISPTPFPTKFLQCRSSYSLGL